MGHGSEALELSGEVARAQFVPLYAKAVRPGDRYLGRKFRLPEEAAAAKAGALRAAAEITDPYQRWMAKHEIRRRGGHASVAAWDCKRWTAGRCRPERGRGRCTTAPSNLR